MTAIGKVASDFLAQKRIAVTGVSRKPRSHGSNVVYNRLRDRGYQVFAVNPNATTVEGDKAYPSLKSIPGGVDTVIIGTRPEIAQQTMRECEELGIRRVWMHGGPGTGSCSPEAADYARQHGITVINGGCPLMFEPTADFGHKLMRLMFTFTGAVPRQVQTTYTFFPDLTVEAAIPQRGIHSQTLSDEAGVELVLFAMAAGERLSEHTSARPAIIHVLAGAGELMVDGDQHRLAAGAWLRMSARTRHAVTAETGLVFALYLL